MRRFVLVLAACAVAQGHDIITTNITFNREILRLVNDRCASCHRPGGTAFSLLTYQDARPWAVAIKEEALERRMPPWGAVKGFGDFRNDQALTPEQLELIVNWVDGGAPEGDEKDLPPPPKAVPPSATKVRLKGEILVSAEEFKLKHEFLLDGLLPQQVPDNTSLQITAELPDGSVEPLLWLYEYKAAYGHPFFLRNPLELPAGSVIHGVAPGASVLLLPPTSTPAQEHQTARY